MRTKSLILLLILIAAFSGFSADKAALKLPSFFSDNMVLQRNFETPIWGKATPGSEISIQVSWLKELVKTTADSDGEWKAVLKTLDAGGPFTIAVKGDTTITLKNILFGDVWLCSGQSNMEMPVDSIAAYFAGAPNFRLEIATAKYSNIRLFKTERAASTTPQFDVTGSWQECNPKTVARFSAVAYFFGKELHQRLNIPIGLIQTCWGGSAAEAWTSKEKLLDFVDFKDRVLRLDSLEATTEKLQVIYEKEKVKWDRLVQAKKDDAFKNLGRWSKPELKDTSWRDIPVPKAWSRTQLAGFTGSVWFRKEINIPKSIEKKDLVLELGPIDEMDKTWFNGKKIGEHTQPGDWATPRTYTVPFKFVKAGKNTLVILVSNEHGEGGITGAPYQLKIYPKDSQQADAIPLSRDWKFKVCIDYKTLPKMPTAPGIAYHRTPTMLYNAMLFPFIPFGIKGAIWYQGESNVYDAELYSRLFPAMIKNWREDWRQGDFPFYYVQIAPYNYSTEPQAAELREAQLKSLSVPNSGMAVTLDLGNKIDIHPRRKVEVSRRLALWALAETYGFEGMVFSGPLYKSHTIENNSIRIYFDYAESGLYCIGDELTHFTIAGSDSVFVPAIATIEGSSVVVSSENVAEPIAVRFGWSNAAEPNLFNLEGLPASSFRTDTWPRKTETKEGK